MGQPESSVPALPKNRPSQPGLANSSNREPGVVWQGRFDLEQLNSEWLKERENRVPPDHCSEFHFGQALRAILATLRNCSRVAPPAAWTDIPWYTVAR